MRRREGGSGTRWWDWEMHLVAELSSRTQVLAQKWMMNGTGQKMERTVMLAKKGGCRAGGAMAMRDGTGADSSKGRCWETGYRWAETGHDKKPVLKVRWDEGVLQFPRISIKTCFFKNTGRFDFPFINLVKSETNNRNNIPEKQSSNVLSERKTGPLMQNCFSEPNCWKVNVWCVLN